ncbi:MAG: PhoPQ-activated pathogenicity-related protein [Planctomycetaceae bacterium]|nr:PhoPQ-activated pathogenicity-related protein [Planctomycetaceae bacterium]
MKLCRILTLIFSLTLCVWTSPCRAQTKVTPPSQPATTAIPTELKDYVNLPDASFAWKLQGKTDHILGRVYDVELTSQTWMDIPWKHVMLVYEPKVVANPNHVLLFITGGSHLNKPNEEAHQMGLALANLAGARVAMLHQVPNQPLLGGRHEDDLITDTILFYLATGDKRWPLLFPMVKSAVKAMDAVEQLAEQEWKSPVAGFVVTGASKRGWTTWLAGATDKRILGIAPIVIDAMNFQKQMDYQIETWGKYSEQIDDYTRKGLVKRMADDKTEPVWKWVDPYTYRSQLTLPKLIINGTNDRYWTVDALNNYWDDLEGEKYIRYVPNAGHNLKGGREAALATLAAFFQHVVQAKPLPKLKWHHATADGKLQLKMSSDVAPISVRLWVAKSPTKDFREAQWVATELTGKDKEYIGEVEKPQAGHVALYGELFFQKGLLEYSLTTQLKRE